MAYAASLDDNTQNLWWTDLEANHDYMILVKAEMASDFLWDYALAWNITADTTHAPLPPSVLLVGSGVVAILWFRRKGRRQSGSSLG